MQKAKKEKRKRKRKNSNPTDNPKSSIYLTILNFRLVKTYELLIAL